MAITQLTIGEYVDLDIKFVGRVEGVVVGHRISGDTIVHTILDVREDLPDKKDVVLAYRDEVVSRTPLKEIIFG